MDALEKPRYGQLAVSEDLTLNFDQDDTWVAIHSPDTFDCYCVMVGLDEIDALIEKLAEVKQILQRNEVKQ